MSAILITIASIAPGGEEALERYAAATIPLIHAAGGKVISRWRPTDTVVGEDGRRPDLVAVMEFENSERIRAFLGSDSYQQQVSNRNRAFAAVQSYIAVEI
jgi:uncharacterized protein (DUF1330 family)